MSTASSATRAVLSPEPTTLAKEKEFMANARILALSNLIDSITVPQAKQGYYGKQLKIIGSTLSSTATSGAELDITVKIHIIEDTWTTCPLLAPSTVLHRWKVDYLSTSSSGTDYERSQAESVSDMISSMDEKRSSRILDTAETISPSPSPTHQQQQQHQQRLLQQQQRRMRPISVASMSSYATQSAVPETHVAVLNSALSLVANKAGDYLVHLSVHVPLVAGANSPSIHLPLIPKCRSNFIKFHVGRERDELEGESSSSTLAGAQKESRVFEELSGLEFNVYPSVAPLEEAHLNPDSDEDAEFWLEAQEELVGRQGVVEKLTTEDDQLQDTSSDVNDRLEEESNAERWQIVGCFTPSSSLHVAWMPQEVPGFVLEVEHDTKVDIKGLPDGPKSSSMLKDRRRKDPEENHQRDRLEQDDEEGSIVYEHLEMDDGDLVISVESDTSLTLQRLGWKQPFAEISISAPTMDQGQTIDSSSFDISGPAVQDWELVQQDEDAFSESGADGNAESYESSHYKVWFFAGTEGKTEVNIKFNISQAVTVGCGKDILSSIPRIDVLGALNVKGRIQVHTGHNLAIQRTISHNVQLSPAEAQLIPDSNLALRLQSALHFQFQSSDYNLTVVAQRYQAVPRIARIERIRAEIGVSSGQQPGFARVTLSNVILPQQNDRYLRIHQLERAEIWNVMVNGNQCSKLIQYVDKRQQGLRTVLVPIPGEAMDDAEKPHQVEISYGFHTSVQDEDGDSTIVDLVVPAVNLPVGEYLVVARLDYDTPTGDFEIMSKEGQPNQRMTITYGAYMTLGRPKLRIATITAPVHTPATATVIRHGDASGVGQDSDVMDNVIEQISRTPAHNAGGAHHPQQPPYMTTATAGATVTHPANQRHPQQPLEPQNPQIELFSGSPAANGSVLVSTSMSSNTAQGSMLSPQIRGSVQHAGSPSSLASPTKRALDLIQSWWKQVMAPLVAFFLVIMIINVAAFQETRITSLDLVGMPAWMKPFAKIGRLWHDSGVLHHNQQHRSQQQLWEQRSEEDFDMPPPFDGYWTMSYVTPPSKPTAANSGSTHAAKKEAPRPNDLELRQPEISKKARDEFEDEFESQQQDKQQLGGFFRLIQILKEIVRGLTVPSSKETSEEESS
ncbi:hypothetical protein BGZ83_010632 [Gryganskiella cystojenkinii]|nr:hypothetical protein BGZ83_010632 [Gryganskiella cystojenkinii]